MNGTKLRMETQSGLAPMVILVKDHSRLLSNQLQQLRLQPSLLDLTLVCENQQFKVHKLVMAACSNLLREELCKGGEVGHSTICFEDLNLRLGCVTLDLIITFAYKGDVSVPADLFSEFCTAARKLGILGTQQLPLPVIQPDQPSLCSSDATTHPSSSLHQDSFDDISQLLPDLYLTDDGYTNIPEMGGKAIREDIIKANLAPLTAVFGSSVMQTLSQGLPATEALAQAQAQVQAQALALAQGLQEAA